MKTSPQGSTTSLVFRRLTIPVFLVGFLMLMLLSVNLTEAQMFGSNWIGQYYSNPDLSGSPSFSRIDQQVNFVFPASPVPNFVPDDNFSVRWTTTEVLAPGTYRFYLTADDGARASLNGTTIMDFFANSGSQQTQTADFTVLTSMNVEMIVEYVERSGNGTIQFFYEGAGGGGIPGTIAPTGTATVTALPPIPPGSLTATVIRAGVLNIRDAPSLGGNRFNRILRGQTYQVVGRNEDATWFLVNLGGTTGWAYGYYLYFNRNEFTAPITSATSLYGFPAGFNDTGVLVQARAGMRMRQTPDLFAEQTGRITWGSFLPVVGKNAAGDWYQVLWKGTIGWVFSGFLKHLEGDFNNVPVTG